MRLRIIANALRAIADELERPRKPPFVVEAAPPGTEPERFVSAPPGSEMDAANQMLARIYLTKALRRFSPTDKPAHA